MDELTGCVGIVGISLGVVVALSLLFSLPVYWLWNWLMPEIFALPTITFWQAMGLSLLTGFLFGTRSSSSSK